MLSRLIAVAIVAVAIAGCATQDEVRAACRDHDGVAAVSGNSVKKNVACRDGYYRTVR